MPFSILLIYIHIPYIHTWLKKVFIASLTIGTYRILPFPIFNRFTRTFTELSTVKMVNFTNLGEKKLKIFEYFESSVRLMDKLREILKDIRWDLKEIMNQEIRSVNNDFAMTMVILTIILLVSPFILMLMRNAMRAVQILSNALKSKYGDLRKEKKRSEKLLYKMLPPVVADAVKSKKKTSWLFESATVFFSEIDEFKELTRACQPLQLFELLNILYKTFDEQIDNYNVYKVNVRRGGPWNLPHDKNLIYGWSKGGDDQRLLHGCFWTT